jgi:glucokinase
MNDAIGIDIGGTRVKAIRVDERGVVQDRRERDTRDDAEALKQTAGQLISDLGGPADDASAPRPAPLGLAAPGLTRPNEPSIHWMAGRLESLVGLDWAGALRREVNVLNDGHAAVMGEAWLGAAKGEDHVVMLTLGTGVGGGVIVDGRLVRGRIGRAGHLGHISLDPNGPLDIVNTPGSLEDAVGDHSIARRTHGQFTTTRDLADAAASGEAQAKAHWHTMIRDLAAGLVSLVNAFDPATIVIGGGVAEAGEQLLQPLEAQFRAWEWQPNGHRVQLERAALGPWAGAIGAARAAMVKHSETNEHRASTP